MSHDREQQPVAQSPSQASPRGPQPATDPAPDYVFDETPIGSSSSRVITPHPNPSKGTPKRTVHIEGPAFELEEITHAFKIAFKPQTLSKHRGSLSVESRWDDGSTTLEVFALVGAGVEQQVLPAGPVSTAEPSSKGPVRLTELSPLDLGEQVIGSHHHFKVKAPQNMGTATAHGAAFVDAATDIKSTWGAVGVLNRMAPRIEQPAIDLEYAPKKSGSLKTLLHFVARWNDGYVEQVSAPITAKARGLDEPPMSGEATPLSPTPFLAVDPGLTKDSGALNTEPVAEWEAASKDDLMRAISSLFDHQKDGVGVVQSEVASFKAEPIEASKWMELAEFAVVLGITYVTLGLGAGVAESLAVATIEPGVAVEERVFTDTVTTVVGARERIPEHSKEMLAETLADGMKEIGAAATKKAIGHHPEPKGNASKPDKAPAHSRSADPTIDFFARQTSVLTDAKDMVGGNMRRLAAQLVSLQKQNPKAAAKAIKVLASTARAYAQQSAEIDQSNATAAQFVVFKTRASLGTETLSEGGKETEVTKLAAAREPDGVKVGPPQDVDGLLSIWVDVTDGALQVRKATVTGVSYLVAARLLDANLATAGVPVRIIVGDHLGFITRDEAGRVRYSGYVHLAPDGGPGIDEAQEHSSAQSIADRLLAKPLSAWGIESIKTNDVNQKAAEALAERQARGEKGAQE